MLQRLNRYIPSFRFSLIIFVLVILALLLLSTDARQVSASEWRTIVWDNNTAELDQLCLTCGIISSDVLWANGYTGAALPLKGTPLLVPQSKSAVLLTWMEVQNQKNGSNEPLVTVKLHGIPLEMRGAAVSQEPQIKNPQAQSPAASSDDSPISQPVTSAEPLAPVKLHGIPLEMRDAAVSQEPQIKTPQAQSPATPPALSEKQSAGTEPREVLKNMRLVVSGDELLILPSGGGRSGRGIVSSDKASLPPLVLEPLAQPMLKPPAASAFVSPGKMMWPVSGRASSGFGKRGKRRFHAGIDIPMPKGTPILAAKDGVVLETCTTQNKKYRGYGNVVLIQHGNGLVSMYAHCLSISVKPGQQIKQGDVVGLVGNTGRTTTHHVHFEVRSNGKAVNPMSYLAAR